MVYLKRLSIILDGDSEKGFGLINAQTTLFNTYDLISLVPTNQATLALACLTHSLPSPLTAHIISLPLTLPRLPFHLKHTLIRTAIKNGAVFEITYVGAVGGENDATLVDASAAENGASAKRNWWGAARELARVCKGKGIIVSSGAASRADLRAPGDIGNLITLLGVPQDVAHSSMSKTPKSLVLRAQTRKTHRAVLSEPRLVIPEGYQPPIQPPETTPSVQTNNPTIVANKRPRDEQEGSKKKKRKKSKQDGTA
ncbi:RNase P subunit p30-domain-containing protein [Armillaria luteobubalina]|uniref:RNase P subunit p30-domain-containing protein n=1 Tax=Armillaria luteobubalina TaxID=153913 RepID=A0AA39QJ75_9AGAR|nr:RNase P subunit p30-domain-containing protein [Armillaria luteobubalina]